MVDWIVFKNNIREESYQLVNVLNYDMLKTRRCSEFGVEKDVVVMVLSVDMV